MTLIKFDFVDQLVTTMSEIDTRPAKCCFYKVQQLSPDVNKEIK